MVSIQSSIVYPFFSCETAFPFYFNLLRYGCCVPLCMVFTKPVICVLPTLSFSVHDCSDVRRRIAMTEKTGKITSKSSQAKTTYLCHLLSLISSLTNFDLLFRIFMLSSTIWLAWIWWDVFTGCNAWLKQTYQKALFYPYVKKTAEQLNLGLYHTQASVCLKFCFDSLFQDPRKPCVYFCGEICSRFESFWSHIWGFVCFYIWSLFNPLQ